MTNFPVELNISTKNNDVHCALVNMRIDGIKRYAPMNKDWPANAEPYRVLVELMTLVAAEIFVDLIRDLVKKHDDKTLKINGRHVPPDEASSAFIARIIDGLVIDNHIQKHADENKEDVDT